MTPKPMRELTPYNSPMFFNLRPGSIIPYDQVIYGSRYNIELFLVTKPRLYQYLPQCYRLWWLKTSRHYRVLTLKRGQE